MSEEDVAAEATILVVDDSAPNVKLLRLILGAAGYRVLDAYSGAEALETLRRERPDAMLLDVRMPGMSGYEVCRQIREDPDFADLPVIMVTALSLAEERITGIEAGATDFISKPFNKKELLARVRASLVMNRHSGILPHLPGAVLLADPTWRTLAMSPLAAILLGISSHDSVNFDFAELLGPEERNVLATGGELVNFKMHRRNTLAARQNPVTTPDGKLILRVITLNDKTES